MIDREYDNLNEYFKRHNAFVEIDMTSEIHSTASHIISTPVLMKVDFASRGRFFRFVEEISMLENLYYEKYLVHKYPTLARAFEEYQLLLKLYNDK